MAPKLTKREQERAAAAAAAAGGEGGAGVPPTSYIPDPYNGNHHDVTTSSGNHQYALGGGDAVSYEQTPSSEELASLFVDPNGSYSDMSHDGGVAMNGSLHIPMERNLLQKRRVDEAFNGGGGAAMASFSSQSIASSEGDDSRTNKRKKTPTRGGTPSHPPPLPSSASQDKGNKGLRHFSMKVCKKVEEKGRTNYNEVADELVREVLQPKCDPLTGVQEPQYDEKNIRRRVYDALNVLMAMDIISKEKKEIRWKGLPSNAQHDIEVLQRDKRRLEQQIAKKREHLQELLMQRIAFKRLIKKNIEREAVAREEQGQGGLEPEPSKISLPFIIINTNTQTVIQVEMTEDRSDIFFNLSAPFEINDDDEALKRMGLHKATHTEISEYVPQELLRYVPPEVYRIKGQGGPVGMAAGGAVGGAAGGEGGLGVKYADLKYEDDPPLPPQHLLHHG